jgi:DNA topoisomerase-2
MYIGSVCAEPVSAWLISASPDEGGGPAGLMRRRDDVAYCPGLLKVFDEIVVNAIDHSTRSRIAAKNGGGNNKKDGASIVDPPQAVKKIEISVDLVSGVLEVANDGDGIPVEAHAAHGGVYVPELIFGHLLTSANYDDEADDEGDDANSSKDGSDNGDKKGRGRTVGGQNGIGAKACNIMAKWFEIEVVDRRRHLRYRQRWEDNMSRALPPVVEKTSVKKARTVVRWLPDYARFGFPEGLSNDMRALMVRRAYDACAVRKLFPMREGT